jgi:hypothetical protein
MIEAKLIQAKLDLIYPIITYASCKHFVAQWIMHPYSQSHLRGSNPDQFNKKLFFISTRALTAPDLQIIRHRTRCNYLYR